MIVTIGEFCLNNFTNLIVTYLKNRNNRLGCYATTLGASIHELAHTFNLGHSDHGIMNHQFNHIDHFFLPLNLEPSTWWTKSEMAILQHHQWLNHNSTAQLSAFNAHFTFDHSRQIVHSTENLIVAEYRQLDSNQVFHYKVWTTISKPIRCYEITFDHEQPFCDNQEECLLFLIDCKGNIFMDRIKIHKK